MKFCKMRASISFSFLISLIVSSVSLAAEISSSSTGCSSVDVFLQCLPSHVNSKSPILDFVYTPKNSSFLSVLGAYSKNLRFFTSETPKPLAIVTANHESHVQATVICAKKNKLQIRIRSGGHDYEGLSYVSDVPFVLLDMGNLRNIDIDIANETAWVQAGATIGELYHTIGNKSKVHGFPAGVCLTLGIGGHITGGGYGNMIRKYGLAVDNVIDATLVNAEGEILNRKSMGEDVFWAIRGGGAASFGVLLSWKIKLVPIPEKVTVFRVFRNVDEGATDIVYQWQHVATKLPKEVFIRVMPRVVNATAAGDKTVSIAFIGFFLGKRKSLVHLLKREFPKLGLQRIDCYEMSWIESAVYFADYPIGTPTDILLNRPTKPVVYSKSKSDFAREVIPKEGLEKIWKRMVQVEKLMWMQWNPYGGRMAEISESETAYPHRAGILFKIQYSSFWTDESHEGIKATKRNVNSLREFHDFMGSYVTRNPREAFMNYRDLDIGKRSSNSTNFTDAEAYGTKYFKGNFQRLVDVKARFDPDNFFTHEQSIPLPSY